MNLPALFAAGNTVGKVKRIDLKSLTLEQQYLKFPLRELSVFKNRGKELGKVMMRYLCVRLMVLFCFFGASHAADLELVEKNSDTDPVYFVSCKEIAAGNHQEYKNYLASSFDPDSVLASYNTAMAMMSYSPMQKVSEQVGKLTREIAVEMSKTSVSDYKLQLNRLLSQIQTSPTDFFGTTGPVDDLVLVWRSEFVNEWYSEYKIKNTLCGMRKHIEARQSYWSLPDDLAPLKIMAGRQISSSSRGTLGDYLDLAGSISDINNCLSEDRFFSNSQCMEVIFSSDGFVVNLRYFFSDLKDVSRFQVGGKFKAKDCLITKPVTIDTFDLDKAFDSLSPKTLLTGTLLATGYFLNIDPGVAGSGFLAGNAVNDILDGQAAHVDRLKVECNTSSLVLETGNAQDHTKPESALTNNVVFEASEVSEGTGTSKSISDVLNLVNQGALDRETAIGAIQKLIIDVDPSTRAQILSTFVSEGRLSGEELVKLIR